MLTQKTMLMPQETEKKEEEILNHQKREIFWASMTLYSMQISMEQRLKKKMADVQRLSNITTLMNGIAV